MSVNFQPNFRSYQAQPNKKHNENKPKIPTRLVNDAALSVIGGTVFGTLNNKREFNIKKFKNVFKPGNFKNLGKAIGKSTLFFAATFAVMNSVMYLLSGFNKK